MTFHPSARSVRAALGGVAGVLLLGGFCHAVPGTSSMSARPVSARSSHPTVTWVQSWGAAMQRPTPGTEDNGPNWSTEGFADQSVRQVIRMSAGGSKVRIRLSNLYGTRPLEVTGAGIARSAGGALAWPGTQRRLTFGGRSSGTVRVGGELVSDSVALPTAPLEKLAVTLRFARPTGPATFHRFTTETSYRATGDHLSDVGSSAYSGSTASWYYLTGVEVAGGGGATEGTVVTFGDSLVDGVGSTAGADSRLPDDLAERLAAAHRPVAVINAGIGGNRLLSDTACYGDRATTRFRRDVLDRPGVRSVIIHLGANDIAAAKIQDDCLKPSPLVTARQLIDGYRALIRAAHARGIKAIGVTIPPMKGALFPMWSPAAEKVRDEVNHWIRTSGEYNAVLDADRALADPSERDRPRPGYVFMDGLHPNDAGYQAIARAVALGSI
ncbi:SGNH/GDSL hydrolase family protein [Actinoallomurus sp. NPDC050550]|uniref:SGNH/GDSL hydrolase family protein n=1 Tax=Actinoallomurus sp. NPDC050550 TaxID=3154937 RepID=UPI0033D4A0CA